MDLQKEREAFDAYFKDKYPELHKDVFDEDGDDRAIIGYSFALSAWMEKAKAQAVPEGFVLVPVTPSDEFIGKLAHVICDEFCTTISGSADCATQAYKLIVETQAPK